MLERFAPALPIWTTALGIAVQRVERGFGYGGWTREVQCPRTDQELVALCWREQGNLPAPADDSENQLQTHPAVASCLQVWPVGHAPLHAGALWPHAGTHVHGAVGDDCTQACVMLGQRPAQAPPEPPLQPRLTGTQSQLVELVARHAISSGQLPPHRPAELGDLH